MSEIPLFVQFLLFFLVFIYAIMLFKSRQDSKFIRRSAFVIMIAGLALYMYGFGLEGYKEGVITCFFRSLILSLKMFVYDGSVFELVTAQRTPLWLDLYYFVFYAAIVTSTSALLMLFGKRAMTSIYLRFRKKYFKHVFIGIDERSMAIANGISDGDVAFLEFQFNGNDDGISKGSFFTGFFGYDRRNIHLMYKKNMVVLSTKCRLEAGYSGNNIFSSLGIDRMKRLINSDTAFYILSENHQRNLDDLMALLGDNCLMNNVIHVCVSRDGVARYYKSTMKQTKVHFIYPSSLSVVELMKSFHCHPSATVKPTEENGQSTGIVSKSFNALVIGFGETGKAITKWLYEFCAAIGKDGLPASASIIVNDECIDSLKGPFIFDNPGLVDSSVLVFENYGKDSSEFWQRLMKRIDDLDYIAISMKDDTSNLDLACSIFMYALSKRSETINDLRIVVRKKHMFSHERQLVDTLNEKAGSEVIVCFGEEEKVFSSEMIVSKSEYGINATATDRAARIENSFENISGYRLIPSERPSTYRERSIVRMELHQLISRANFIPTLRRIAGSASLNEIALENLAKTEHLRFSRYLLAHGYRYGSEDNGIFKTNHQICDWESLSDTDRQYHRDMVLAMLNINEENPVS